MRAIIGWPHSRRDGRMSVTQSWAMRHHVDFIAAADKSGGLAGQRKDHGNFGLVAADVSEVANVSLELIPVALVGKSNDGIELFPSHQLAHPRPTPLALQLR